MVASSDAGPFTVTATAPDVSGSAEFKLVNQSAVAEQIMLASGGTQSTVASTPFAAPLVVEVVDNFGNPVSGITCSVALPAAGPSATPSTVSPVTDATGKALFTLVANDIPGLLHVSVFVAGATVPATTTLTIAPMPTAIALTTAPESPIAEGETVSIAAAVTSSLATPTGDVRISVDGAAIAQVTLSDGKATTSVPSLAAGSYAVTATYAAQGAFAASTAQALTLEVTAPAAKSSGCAVGERAGAEMEWTRGRRWWPLASCFGFCDDAAVKREGSAVLLSAGQP